MELLPSRGKAIPTNRRSFNAKAVWSQYASTRPFAAASPELECVAFHVRNRDTIIAEATKVLTNMDQDEIEAALREVLAALLEEGGDVTRLSGNARDLAGYLDERLCVPRDMGVLPAATLRTLAAAAPKPRIASR